MSVPIIGQCCPTPHREGGECKTCGSKCSSCDARGFCSDKRKRAPTIGRYTKGG